MSFIVLITCLAIVGSGWAEPADNVYISLKLRIRHVRENEKLYTDSKRRVFRYNPERMPIQCLTLADDRRATTEDNRKLFDSLLQDINHKAQILKEKGIFLATWGTNTQMTRPMVNMSKMNSLPRCKRYDPNLNECLKKAIQSSMPTLAPGIPRLGISALDPLKISALQINQGTGPVGIDLKFMNLLIRGIGNATLTKVVADLDNYRLEIQGYITVPIEIDGSYSVKGNVLILPLAGSGKCHLSLENVKASIYLTGVGLKKKGRDHFNLKNLAVELKTSRLRMNFENLVSQNKALGDNMNLFLNENWQVLWQELYQAVTGALGIAFKSIASRVFAKVPMDDIFLP